MYKKSVFLALLFVLLWSALLLSIHGRTVVASPSTTVYISPPTTTATVSQTITVYIAVSAVNNLWGWQAGMSFNPNVLQCLSFEQDEFLKRGGTTLWQPGTIDNTNGKITAHGCTLTTGSTPVSGSGNLAKVKFRCKNAGSSILHLTDVILVDQTPNQIPASISDGAVHVSAAVGGVWIPINKIGLLTTYIGLASTILLATAATAIYVKHRKKKQ